MKTLTLVTAYAVLVGLVGCAEAERRPEVDAEAVNSSAPDVQGGTLHVSGDQLYAVEDGSMMAKAIESTRAPIQLPYFRDPRVRYRRTPKAEYCFTSLDGELYWRRIGESYWSALPIGSVLGAIVGDDLFIYSGTDWSNKFHIRRVRNGSVEGEWESIGSPAFNNCLAFLDTRQSIKLVLPNRSEPVTLPLNEHIDERLSLVLACDSDSVFYYDGSSINRIGRHSQGTQRIDASPIGAQAVSVGGALFFVERREGAAYVCRWDGSVLNRAKLPVAEVGAVIFVADDDRVCVAVFPEPIKMLVAQVAMSPNDLTVVKTQWMEGALGGGGDHMAIWRDRVWVYASSGGLQSMALSGDASGASRDGEAIDQ